MAKRRNADKLDNLYFKAVKLIEGGMSKHTAMEKVGINVGTFYRRENAGLTEDAAPVKPKRIYKKRAAAVTLEVPEPSTEGRVAVFVGSPSQVADAVKGLL